MLEHALDGKSVLIVEDDYLLARELADCMERAGARVIGPVPSLVFAFEEMQTDPPDIAILDIRLGTGNVFPLAEHLRYLSIPFVFASAHASSIPPTFGGVRVFEKPVHLSAMTRALEGLAHARENRTAPKPALPAASDLVAVEAQDYNHALRIAQMISQRTGHEVTIFDDEMIEIGSIPAPRKN